MIAKLCSLDLTQENIFLFNGDYVNVPGTNILEPIQSVKITGEVKIPGIYPVNNLTTLGNILNLAGGYTDNALEDGIEIFTLSKKGLHKPPYF
mgnify:CR=1 FL=1